MEPKETRMSPNKVTCRVRLKRKAEVGSARSRTAFELEFDVDDDEGEENAEFFRAYPTGKLHLNDVSKQVAEALEVGREYLVHLEPAPG